MSIKFYVTVDVVRRFASRICRRGTVTPTGSCIGSLSVVRHPDFPMRTTRVYTVSRTMTTRSRTAVRCETFDRDRGDVLLIHGGQNVSSRAVQPDSAPLPFHRIEFPMVLAAVRRGYDRRRKKAATIFFFVLRSRFSIS